MITIQVDPNELKMMVDHLKTVEPEYKVLNPEKLLELLIKKQLENYGVFLDMMIDGGGNALIGDVLEDEEAVGVVVDTRDEEPPNDKPPVRSFVKK